VIRCAIAGRYFAPPRGLQEGRRRAQQLGTAALNHLRAIARQAMHPMTGSPSWRPGERKASAVTERKRLARYRARRLAIHSPLRRLGRDHMRLWPSPSSSAKRLA